MSVNDLIICFGSTTSSMYVLGIAGMSAARVGIISTIVTVSESFFSAMKSAASTPTSPPPAITTFAPTFTFPMKTSSARTT